MTKAYGHADAPSIAVVSQEINTRGRLAGTRSGGEGVPASRYVECLVWGRLACLQAPQCRRNRACGRVRESAGFKGWFRWALRRGALAWVALNGAARIPPLWSLNSRWLLLALHTTAGNQTRLAPPAHLDPRRRLSVPPFPQATPSREQILSTAESFLLVTPPRCTDSDAVHFVGLRAALALHGRLSHERPSSEASCSAVSADVVTQRPPRAADSSRGCGASVAVREGGVTLPCLNFPLAGVRLGRKGKDFSSRRLASIVCPLTRPGT